jgi:tetratricopeptide (TPR) repeat protein
MRRWFLSYHSPDLALAERLEAALRRRDGDVQVFFAHKTLRAGGYWQPALAEAIAQASAFVLVVGEKGLGPWQVVEYYEALDKRVKSPDFPVVLVLLEGQSAPGLPFLRQLHWIIAADPASEQAVARLAEAASGGGARPGELWRYTSPYRGLAAMTEADSDFFFGREREAVEVLATVAADPDRLPVLLGNSGVGKSSLAQAGVLAALKRQAWPEGASASGAWPSAFRESRHWCFLTMKPGTEPLKALVASFLDTWQLGATDPVRIKQQHGWIELLLDGKASLRDLLDATERRYDELNQPRPPAFFLYVDQGEELYVRADEQQRRRFSSLLAQQLADPRLVALASMRSDFLGALQNDEPLYAVHHKIDVAPLREAELREVVSRPAELLSARFETAELAADIARRAAEESAKDAGALPLLSYLLDDMWTQMVKRGDGVLRLPAQAMELGGVLAERANGFLACHPKAEEALRRMLTLKLATVREDGEPTRRLARRSEFSDEEWRLISELADHPHRLLVTATPEGGETYAEVAHEAIFRRWDKLREWMANEREFLVWKSALEADRRSWEQASEGSRDDALLMGLSLAQAQSWLAKRAEDLPKADREFIGLSLKREEREWRQKESLRRRVLMTAVGALVVVTLFAILSFFEWREALKQEQAAEQERVRTVSAVETIFFTFASTGEGKGDRAIAGLDRDITQDPSDAAAYLSRGIMYYVTKQDSDRAAADFDQVVRLNPKMILAYLFRAEVYSGRGNYDQAIVNHDEVIKLDPKNAFAYAGRGSAYYSKNDYDRALADFDQAIGLDPRYPAVYNARGKIYYDRNAFDRAIADYDQAIKLDPRNALAYYNRGEAYYARTDYDEAIADYGEAIRLFPKYVLAYTSRGNAYSQKQDYDRAIADYSEAIALDPKYAAAYGGRGWAYYGKKAYDSGLADYSEAIALDPNYVDAYNNRGLAYYAKGDYDRAIQDFDAATKLNPDYVFPYNNRGLVYTAKGSYDRAIKELDAAITLAPDYAQAYGNRGIAYDSKGDYERAIRDYDEAIRLDPENATFWNERCFERAIIGRLEEALADCNESIRLEPDAAETLDSRGLVYLKLGQLDNAIADYDAALRLDAKLAGSLHGRGMARLKKGDAAGGNADITAAKAINPDVAKDFARYGVQ